MIDKAILDEVLPVPELETLKEEKIAELKEEGFAITNFHSGGVFYTRTSRKATGKRRAGKGSTPGRPSSMTSYERRTMSTYGESSRTRSTPRGRIILRS